jgi:hypothetical protein
MEFEGLCFRPRNRANRFLVDFLCLCVSVSLWLVLGRNQDDRYRRFFSTNHTFAGRSARRRMYQGNQSLP